MIVTNYSAQRFATPGVGVSSSSFEKTRLVAFRWSAFLWVRWAPLTRHSRSQFRSRCSTLTLDAEHSELYIGTGSESSKSVCRKTAYHKQRGCSLFCANRVRNKTVRHRRNGKTLNERRNNVLNLPTCEHRQKPVVESSLFFFTFFSTHNESRMTEDWQTSVPNDKYASTCGSGIITPRQRRRLEIAGNGELRGRDCIITWRKAVVDPADDSN